MMPAGVKAIGIAFEVLSILVFLVGIALLVPGNISKQTVDLLNAIKHTNLALGWPLGMLLAVVSFVIFAVALEFTKGRKWAWWAMVVLLVVNGLPQLVAMPRGLFGVVIIALLLYYLTRKNIRENFA